MTLTSVSSARRFTRNKPCPICDSHSQVEQGTGERCYGYMSDDGEYANCTRTDLAGSLEERTDRTYGHKLYGDCKCYGKQHNPPHIQASSNGHKAKAKANNQDLFSYDDPRATAYFPYYDEQATLLYTTVRYEWPDKDNPKGHSKTVRPFHKENGKQVSGLGDVRRVLYRLPDLLKSDKSQTLYIAEGENKVEALRKLGLLATCNPLGAKKWQKQYGESLKGFHVVILPDNDPDGYEHAKQVTTMLQPSAASVRVVTLPDLPPKGDVIDWLAAGGTKEQLEALCKPPEPIEPGKRFSDIQEKALEWFWEKWIPRGKITMIDAMPDQGKSVLCTTFAAYASKGRDMPDGSPCVQGAAILVNIEDDASDTVKPRLLAAGADVSKVIDLSNIRYRNENGEIEERSFMIPRDLPVLEEQIIKHGVVLVCLDPLMAILDSSLKSSNDQDVRQALTPLARLLERTRCACLIVRHFNKGSSDNAIIRGAGSMGIVGAARSQLFVTPDPDNSERHILAMGKHNLSPTGTPNLIYSIISDSFGRPKIKWEGTSVHSTAELLSTSKPSVGRQEVKRIMNDLGRPIGALDIVENADNITYENARKLLARMARSKEIVSPSRGIYTMSQVSQVSQPSHLSQVSQLNNNNNNSNNNFYDWDRDWDSEEKCPNPETASKANSSPIGTLGTDVTGQEWEDFEV